MLVLGQSPLQPDQYRSSIKSSILLYLLSLNQLRNQQQLRIQLETTLCNVYHACNTELRIATVTKIKGLSIQTQLNTFVLFTLLN